MIASISHPEVTSGLNLSYGASGTYGGWDRFGRIVDQLWAGDSANTIDQIEHTYDRGGNRLTRTNGLNSALDEVYTYDGLDRLIDTNRGGADLQDWSLDALGNWREFTDGATTQTRTNNAANEITGISGGGWIAPAYDAAGNMTSGPKPGAETTRLHFKYDAWNRLVEVKDDNAGVPGTTIATYEYDGRNYRVEKTVGTDTSDVFYNEAWQVLEVRNNGDTDPLEQNIWDQRYIDAPVVRFYDANTDGDYADAADSTLYYVQDANFNVTALVDAATGNVVERYSYDPYGKATVYDASWNVRPSGSAYANELQYASYRLDPETGLYQVRNRFYHTALGMWISRDPIQADINLYRYVHNSPLNLTDPLGLADCKCPPTKKECDAAIAQIDNTIAQMVRFASDGHNHTLAEALAVSKAWATTTGHRSEELKEQPCFFQQAVEDVETSNVLRVTTGVVWFEEWVGSSLPNWIFDNTNWNTGNGDVWMRMEMWRSGMLKKRIQVLCKDAK